MNQDPPKWLRWVAAIAASAVVLCVLLLSASYVTARIQAPKDERIVADLKKQVREDPAIAPTLEAEHKRITAALQRRKQRDHVTAIVLIAVAALFIASAKWLAASSGRRRLPNSPLVQLQADDRDTGLLRYRVTEDCIGCTCCAQVCPAHAIARRPYERHAVDRDLCICCDICRQTCQQDAIELI